MEGLGDIIEAIIPDAIKPKNCEGCKRRKQKLNEKIPLPSTVVRILTRSKRKTKSNGIR